MRILVAVVALLAVGTWAWAQDEGGESENGALVLHEYFNVQAPPPGAESDRSLPAVERDGVTLPPPTLSAVENGEEPTYTSGGVRDPSAQPLPEKNGSPMRDERMRLDDDTRKEGTLQYYSVFNPSVIPFKRGGAFDMFEIRNGDYEMRIQPTQMVPVEVGDPGEEAGYERFSGSLMIDAMPGQAVPIPSVAPDSRILGYVTYPEAEVDFYKDSADNFYVIADHTGALRLNFLTDARTSYFGTKLGRLRKRNIPDALRPPPLPREAVSASQIVLGEIGVDEGDRLDVQIRGLVSYFRDFEATAMDDRERRRGDRYMSIALSQKGVCRHRAFSFVITAHALGIPARYVYNEAHAWVEVYVPQEGAGWMRVDLGGEAEGLNVSNSGSKLRHHTPTSDPFEQPEGFNEDYSRVASSSNATERAGFENITNLPPSTEEYVATEREVGGILAEVSEDGEGVEESEVVEGEASEDVETTPLAELAPGTTDVAAGGGAPMRRVLQTEVALTPLPEQALRGRTLVVQGRLGVVESGTGMSGRDVAIWLRPADGSRGGTAPLATVETGLDGSFEVEIALPQTMAVGDYELVARFAGDRDHTAAESE